ncbi:uncharacterized protein THITE_2110271 [Thermothielavioides terrestris NRRL 8126]|uniref:MARVEL domain-containing protein n=1 Tax=Thermothielavioides terrestris (strain ATCC 38088 / NRRL 8126) TaxID=578455 RepID=G2QS97_THETT|nr:uncharacterized protein THITE_2110271 [Thermothielavioides terrestris NRRL 8126]AEO64286.1 hypothetical protein THITE_2110271 [Thermothielavioides terrestris NRRL 8126]
MGWELSTWLALARAFQLLGSLAATVMHGYLTIHVYVNRDGLSAHMVVLELLACLLLGYSTLAIALQHTGQRSSKTPWLTGFAVCDVLVCAVLLGIISTLAHAGLPVHCGGMTRSNYLPGDRPNFPSYGYTTIRFSDESPGQRGELDYLCGLDRSYYVIANTLIFTYIFTITVTVLRALEKRYTKTTRVNELLESLERAEEISLKVMESPSRALDEPPRPNLPPPEAPSEGILTRNPSLRSNLTAATVSASSHAGPHAATSIPRRPVPPPQSRRPRPSIPPSPASPPVPEIPFVPVPLDDEDPAEAALVADGMQHQRPHQHQPPYYQHHHHHSSSSSHSPPRMLLPILSEEVHRQSDADADAEADANAALVSDGMRPSEPTLPPYRPGNRRMSGHAAESNEMRLSEYIKGQTRAQALKDSGRY